MITVVTVELACDRAPRAQVEVDTARVTTATAATATTPATTRPRLPSNPTLAADALPALSDLPPARRAIQVVGDERQVDADAARARGLFVVDLSDAWAPTI